ncbi:hypothetical protein [Nocardioides perillae]|uniref:Uncharacterized protein n=1 Tax=Nocardioides perillae TaxID=1119534 RepID=A0A7Y9UKU9_9ACTN|nr:hypothetical protein [Nocardioides perillae]NYG54342.1 hypothetical protein [Nocardioides perillae]
MVRSRSERIAALPLRDGLRVAAVTGLVRALAGYAGVTALVLVVGVGTPTTAASPGERLDPGGPVRVVELDEPPVDPAPPAAWP